MITMRDLIDRLIKAKRLPPHEEDVSLDEWLATLSRGQLMLLLKRVAASGDMKFANRVAEVLIDRDEAEAQARNNSGLS
jgi:hypothetical protein